MKENTKIKIDLYVEGLREWTTMLTLSILPVEVKELEIMGQLFWKKIAISLCIILLKL